MKEVETLLCAAPVTPSRHHIKKKIKTSIYPTYIWHVLYRDRANYTHHECRHVEEVQYETKGVGSLLLICY